MVEVGLHMFRPIISLPIIVPDGPIHLYLGPINTRLPNISALTLPFWRFATGKFSLTFPRVKFWNPNVQMDEEFSHELGYLPKTYK